MKIINKTVKDIIDWIELNLENPLSVGCVVKKSGYSRRYLHKIFKEMTGKSLANYIKNRRIEQAALDLKFTHNSILYIAIQYQFDSDQSFNRNFKKRFNITPSAYRKNHRY